MKRMMSRREIEIAERIDELEVNLKHAWTGLKSRNSDLLRYEACFEELGDESLLPYIQSAKLDIEYLEYEVQELQIEIEELEKEAKTA